MLLLFVFDSLETVAKSLQSIPILNKMDTLEDVRRNKDLKYKQDASM